MFSIFGKKETAEKKQQRQQREIQQLEQQKNILDYKIKDISSKIEKMIEIGKEKSRSEDLSTFDYLNNTLTRILNYSYTTESETIGSEDSYESFIMNRIPELKFILDELIQLQQSIGNYFQEHPELPKPERELLPVLSDNSVLSFLNLQLEDESVGCPSGNKKPQQCVDKKDYTRQALIFHSDRNPHCKNKEMVDEKFKLLGNLCSSFTNNGGSKKKKYTKKNIKKNKKRTKSYKK